MKSMKDRPGAGSIQGENFLIAGFHGTSPDREWLSFLSACRPAGVILFQRNIESPEQLFDCTARLRDVLGDDLLISIDLEGGTVNRFSPLMPFIPGAMATAAGGDPAPAFQNGLLTGELLSLFGVSINYAPVLDCTLSLKKNALGTRTYGSRVETVTDMAAAYLDGLSRADILSTGKHFPGLGRARHDPHLDLPAILTSKQELEDIDLRPYMNLVPGLDLVMVGHGAYPALTGDEDMPASTSRAVIEELLRREIGFSGAVISDDLEMGAFSDERGFKENSARAFKAGCDLLLVCHTQDRIMDAAAGIHEAVSSGTRGRSRGEASRARIQALKRKAIGRRPVSLDRARYGDIREKFEALNRQVAEKSVTLVQGDFHRLSGTWFVCDHFSGFQDSGGTANPLLGMLREDGFMCDPLPYAQVDGHRFPAWLARQTGAREKTGVLLVTKDAHENRAVHELVVNLKAAGAAVVHISLGLPGDVNPNLVDHALAVYSSSEPALRAAANVLTGKKRPAGRLPVDKGIIEEFWTSGVSTS